MKRKPKKLERFKLVKEFHMEEDNGNITMVFLFPTTKRLLSILAHSFNFVMFTIIFNKKYNYEPIIFTLLLILLIKNLN